MVVAVDAPLQVQAGWGEGLSCGAKTAEDFYAKMVPIAVISYNYYNYYFFRLQIV